MKILIIDDDPTLSRLLSMYLEHVGHEIIAARGGAEGLAQFSRHHPDLVVLDVMMPSMDGWEVLERLRAESDVPVIMLTAKVMPHDVVHGLRLGADDYIRKPFNLEELNLRILAVQRRSQQAAHPCRSLRYQDAFLLIDFDRRLVLRCGEAVHLSPTEFRLLCYLAENQARCVPHQEILTHVWGPDYVADTNTLSVYIRYLRQKLETDPDAPRYIHTQWGTGYSFDPPASS
jgi:two-component system KDP operon response regulator KdpE